jgi:hypothetical protein
MKPDASRARVHRALCIGAMVHAAVSLALLFVAGGETLLVGVTTLWFFWPIVIALHAGRTAGRAYVSMAVSAVLLALPMKGYLLHFGPSVLMGDVGPVSFHPFDFVGFTAGYVSGWMESNRRAGAETIELKGYGMGGNDTPGVPQLSATAAKRFKLRIDSIALCGVDSHIIGRAAGFNRVSAGVLKRRYGADIMQVLQREWELERQRYEMADEVGRKAAETDIAAGQLTLEVLYEQTSAAAHEIEMASARRYGIALRQVVSGEDQIGLDVLRRVSAYNGVIESEINRRYGVEVAEAVVNEAQRRYLLPARGH